MSQKNRPTEPIEYEYLPALKWHILTRFYRLVCNMSFLGTSYKRALLSLVTLQKGDTILDVGCGPGDIIEAVKQKYPDVAAFGADPDDVLLEIARKNLAEKNLSAELVRAYAEHLPFPDNSFDVVFCVLTLHHIPPELKVRALEEMRRVLKPSGTLLLSDYGKKKIPVRGPSQWIFERKANLKDHFEGKISSYVTQSGLRLVTEKEYHHGIFIWVAQK